MQSTHFRTRLTSILALVALSLAFSGCSVDGESAGAESDAGVGPGISERPSEPFVPSDEVGEKPPVSDLVAASMSVVNAQVWVDTSTGVKEGAESGGATFQEVVFDGDPVKNSDQLNSLLNQDVGAVYSWTGDATVQAPIHKQLMDSGAAVFPLSGGPGTMPMVANQADFGTMLGETAADYIRDELDGDAEVVLFNLDTIDTLKARFEAIRDAIGKVPGATIVSDVTIDIADADWGFRTMNSILQAHPDVDVVIGDDPQLLSALAAVQAAGKEDQIGIFGAGGDSQALNAIKEGGAYKATMAFNFSIVGYAAGAWGADWIAGKQIPALTLITGIPLTNVEQIEQFEADFADPAGTFADKLDTYLEPLGNISYETRQNYWDSTNPQ